MQHYDHVRLIQKGVEKKRQVWADFGSGDGAFTLALRDTGGVETDIYSIDKDEDRLKIQKKIFDRMFSEYTVHFIHEDFTHPLDLPPLDGIIMANSLHFLEKKIPFLIDIKQYLKRNGKLILVEYNVDSGNMWVPYPISFRSFKQICRETGFQDPELLGEIPSEFLKEIYSAQTYVR